MSRVVWVVAAVIGAVGAAAAIVVATAASRPQAASDRPRTSVLMVVLDTTRADRCSFLGYGRPTTPNLEALAAESIVFEDAWSSAPWTLPAHASLFTGRPAWELGVVERELVPLDPRVPTLAQELAASGRATGCFTANAWIEPQFGLTTGFGAYELTRTVGAAGTARDTNDVALAWMREQRRSERPFFAFVNVMEPHTPYRPSLEATTRLVPADLPPTAITDARRIEGTRSLGLSLGRELFPPDTRRAMSSLYDAEIADLDTEVGRLISAMRSDGMLDDTLLVILGDHGEGLADHGWVEHGVRMDREVMRVPMLVRLPGGDRGGSRVRDLVRLEDVMPTVLEVCGVGTPAGVRGLSLLRDTAGRVATAKHTANREFQEVVSTSFGPDALAAMSKLWRSVCDGRHHLVAEERMPLRLYDLAADPGEQHDVAVEHPDVVARLSALLPE